MSETMLLGIGASIVVLGIIGLLVLRSRRTQKNTSLHEQNSAPKAFTATPIKETPADQPLEGSPAPREVASISPLRQVVPLALGSADLAKPYLLDMATTQHLLSASQELARIGHEPRYTPSRPTLLPQLLEAIDDEDASLRALSRIISQDPTLTGDLLRTANSALYRVSGNPIESVERAAAMLGTQGLRTLITSALVKPLTGDPSSAAANRFVEVIWEHSIYSASAAEAWAARAQDCDPFSAHLLGLMHGLGDVAVYRVVRDIAASHPDADSTALVTQAVATQGAVAARRIAASWGLSDRTQEALEAQSAAAPSMESTPLARALHFGRLAGAVALLCRRKKMDEASALKALEIGGFSGPQVARIWDRLVLAYVRP